MFNTFDLFSQGYAGEKMSCKKARGKRAKTRSKICCKGGKLTVNKLLRKFEKGSSVQVVIDSSLHSGMPFKNFHGCPGVVVGEQGKVFVVDVKQGAAKKRILAHAGHLQQAKA